MIKFFFAFILSFTSFVCVAQSDSTVMYLHRSGRITTADSGYYYIVFKKTDSAWYGKTYFKKRRTLYTEGNYIDAFPNRQSGIFRYYTPNGILDQVVNYKDGLRTEATWYFSNGNKKAWVLFREGTAIPEQKAWDMNGKENPNYTVYKNASFEGGNEAWIKYLSKNLRADVALRAGLGKGVYSVLVDFAVLPHGGISAVKPITYPENCKPCVTEAIRIIQSSPYWHPAILDNEAIISLQRQKISFIVE